MKKLLSTLLFVTLLMLVTTGSVHAQEPSFWERFTGGIKSQLQRIYLKFPGEKSGQAVLSQMIVSMRDVKTAQTESVIKVISETGQMPFAGEWKTQGVMEAGDIYDYTSIRQQQSFSGAAQGQDLNMIVNGEMVHDGSVLYLKFSELPAFPLFDLARAKGMWIKIDQSVVSPDASMSGKPNIKTELTTDEKQHLRIAHEDLLRSAEISNARKEELDGTPVFVTDLTFSKEALTTYATRVSEIMNNEGDMTAEQKAHINESISQLAPLSITVSVDRNTYYLRRVVMPLSFSMSQVTEGQQSGVVSLNVDMKWTDHNQPVVIDVPAEAKDVQEVMQEVMPAAGGVMQLENVQKMVKDNEGKMPVELQGLSAQEKKMLREMGIEL